MKLIRMRTSQRALVGFAAEVSSMAASAGADVRFMSGIISLDAALYNKKMEN
jgi:hypothetical protein